MKIPNYFYYSLAILWAYSGVIPIAFNQADSLAMLAQMGIPDNLQWFLFILSSLMDVAFAVLILTKLKTHPLLWLAQFITVAVYSVLIGIFLPDNWLHPFAPLIKNVPILAMLWFLFQNFYGENQKCNKKLRQ